MNGPAIEARSLTRRFGDTTAVDRVDFTVGFGEVVGLLGANGAGKTTAIRMLAGLLAPTGGAAHLLGRPPDRTSQRRLGYVPQGLGLYGDLTVRENLAFSAVVYDVETATLTGTLADAADRPVADLPLGLQRQLAFTVAAQHRPDVMMLDEPTSGVGALSAARLWDRIRSSAERGVAVLVSTHSMDEARRCDRLLLMADGKIVARGTEADIVAGVTVVEVEAERWERAFTTLVDAGMLVTLDGRTSRVVGRSPGDVAAALRGRGVTARVREVPGTIDERMASIGAGRDG